MEHHLLRLILHLLTVNCIKKHFTNKCALDCLDSLIYSVASALKSMQPEDEEGGKRPSSDNRINAGMNLDSQGDSSQNLKVRSLMVTTGRVFEVHGVLDRSGFELVASGDDRNTASFDNSRCNHRFGG